MVHREAFATHSFHTGNDVTTTSGPVEIEFVVGGKGAYKVSFCYFCANYIFPPSATFWLLFQSEVCVRCVVRGLERVRGGVALIGRSPTTFQCVHIKTKFCSMCRRLAGIPMPNYDPHVDPRTTLPPLRLEWTKGDGKWYQSKCQHNTPVRLHTIGLSSTVWTQYIMW